MIINKILGMGTIYILKHKKNCCCGCRFREFKQYNLHCHKHNIDFRDYDCGDTCKFYKRDVHYMKSNGTSKRQIWGEEIFEYKRNRFISVDVTDIIKEEFKKGLL